MNSTRKTNYIYLTGFILFYLICENLNAQKISNEEIHKRIENYKSDSRGPYKEIRWYCPDGSIIPPKERCPEPGGVQRARHKDEVVKLADQNHIFLGQILTTTPHTEFWDLSNNHSRLKQYQLENYLRLVDNGWVLRRAQFYRGAYQAEDEEQWGVNFFNWLLADNEMLTKNFFLIRQAAKDIPHQGDNNLTQNIRTLSKVLSDEYTPFLDLRVKIHGQPDESDIVKVISFRDKHQSKLSPEQLSQFGLLIRDMQENYKPVDLKSLKPYLGKLPKGDSITGMFTKLIEVYPITKATGDKIELLADHLLLIRESIAKQKTASARLALMDISIALEKILFREQSGYQVADLGEKLRNIYNLSKASAGCGYIELWEWEDLKMHLSVPLTDDIRLDHLIALFEAERSMLEWSAGMFRAVYSDVINLFMGFEPLAYGFLDEKIRGSVLLLGGQAINTLGTFINTQSPTANKVLDIPNQSTIRGLNSGFAMGELVVIGGQADDVEVNKNKIYIFDRPPADLKPVDGIATVSEGNPVSHVQLLARNLAIPNAVISSQNLDALKKYSGQEVFYAVSAKGAVVMKLANQMLPEEKQLFEKKERSYDKIEVPVEKMELKKAQVLNLRDVNASSSGIICGPKAANLGQLKTMFPENVVEGLVIPFGIFREHLNQSMPGQELSYWDKLNAIFSTARTMAEEGGNEAEIEMYVLKQLADFRKAIEQLSLSAEFIQDLNEKFLQVFGKQMGTIPVFLRSDTNMEDLKDFTGAGLNLTLFNVIQPKEILNGIKSVWASPYTERSYKWRQHFLLNPENVFPSILIIPSVDVDYSGVLITTGLSSQNPDDITIAFSRGAGGAVDGQAAESYLLKASGENLLLSPSREPSFKSLPTGGGAKMNQTSFELPILNPGNIESLRSISESIREKLPQSRGIETKGPFDVELGFKDNKLWLFQVRPFVENKNAAASVYLESLNVHVPVKKKIRMDQAY